MTYSTAKRICQTRQRRSTDSAPFRKPHITIPRRRRKNEWLRQPGQNLAKHDDTKDAAVRPGARISNPVTHQQQHRRSNYTLLWSTMQDINNERTCYHECKLEAR